MALNIALFTVKQFNFFLARAHDISSDLRPETGFDAWFVKILTFQAEFLLLNPQFLRSLPFVLFLLPQIFLHFPADCGSRNVGNKDEQRGAIGLGRSRGCIATSYLPLSDSAELQCLDKSCGDNKVADLQILPLTIQFLKFRVGDPIQVLQMR